MFTTLSHVFLWVRDQQEAKDFSVGKEPTEHFYGVDAAFRDPSGNQWRITQPAPVVA